MNRVGFVMTQTVLNWNGGVSYLRNLVHALRSVPKPTVEPMLLVPPDTPDRVLTGFQPVGVIRSALIGRTGRRARRVAGALLGRDLPLERLLEAHGIEVMSHSDPLGSRSAIPVLGWLPDFQHCRFPAFFSPQELAARDRQFRRTIDCSTLLLLSSHDAQTDLAAFSPSAVAKSRVLHFTSGAGEATVPPTLTELERKYGFQGAYFFVPNQFWAHKNHKLILEALAELKSRGRPALVLATGNTHDYRHPEVFADLMQHVKALDVGDCFRVLGIVPYDDLFALMRGSTAVINPSFFEGWSTTVEESKSFGKRILLSDIPVHREQAPERGTYFSPHDAHELAAAMLDALMESSLADEESYHAAARENLPSRFVEFGRAYERIVAEVLENA